MSVRKIIAILILIAGIFAIGYALHSMKRLANARQTVETVKGVTGPVGGSPVGKMVSGAVDAKLSSYDTQVMWLLIGGVVATVVGGGMLLFNRRR